MKAPCVLLSAATILAFLQTGCLVEQTVTRNGEVREQGYVIKRPIKDTIERTKEFNADQ